MRDPSAYGQRRIAAIAIVAAASLGLSALVLWPVAFAGRVPAFGDNISFWSPNTCFWTGEFHAGRFPGWNPYIMCGVPFAADINHGIFYPPNWLALINDRASCLRLLVVTHVAFGMCGVYVFARGFEISRPAAAWAGFAFGLCESFLPLSNHVVMLESMSWIGFALRAAWSCASGGGPLSVLALALCVGLSALAGDIHATYIICVACGVLAVAGSGMHVAHLEGRAAVRALLLPLAGVVAGMLVAAVAVIPAVQIALLSERASGAASYSSYHSLDPKAALGCVLPSLFGSIHDGTVWNFRAGNAVFVGLVTLALAAWAMRKPLESLAQVILFIVGIAFALGAYNPAWALFQKLLPGLRYFRQPREYFIIAAIALIVLAAGVISRLLNSPRAPSREGRVPWLVVLGVSASICLAAIAAVLLKDQIVQGIMVPMLARYADGAGEIGRRVVTSISETVLVASLAACALAAFRLGALSGLAAGTVVGVLVLADLGLASWGSLVFGPSELCSGRTAMADALRAESKVAFARVVPAADGFGEYFEDYGCRRLGGRLRDESADMPTLLKVKSCLVDNEPSYAGVSSALGYSTFITRRYAALWRAAGASEVSPVRLRYTGPGKYWLFGANYILEASRNWDDCRTTRFDAGDIRMVYHWTPAAGFDQAVGLVTESPERAYLAPVVEGIKLHPQAAPLAEVKNSIENIWRGTGVLTLRVFTDGPGLLYVPDCNYPGWEASDNGAPARIYNANIAFRAVYLSAGKHDVEFHFSPTIFYWGAAVSALAVFAGVLVAVGCLRVKSDE